MKALPVSLASMLFATTALSQALPDQDELSERVAERLPSYWTVTGFRQVAQTDLGDAARPQALIRFEADSVPTGPLYTRVDEQEPFAIIVPTQSDEEARILYGVMDLSYRAGAWSGDVEIENSVDGLGQPADLFDRPTLVMGDPEADKRIAQLREQRETNAVARFEREMNSLQNEHKAALQEIQQENETELAAARRDHAAALSRMRSTQVEERSAIEARHEATISDLARDHETALTEMRVEHAAEVSALEQEQEALEGGLEERVAELRARQAEELETATAEHESTMRALAQEHRMALQDARASQDAAIVSLERDLQSELLELTEGLEPQVQAARQQHANTLSELRLEHEAELEEKRVAHAQARGALREELNEEIAAAEIKLQAEIGRLERQLGRSEEAQALQAAFLASVEARSEAARELQQEMERLMIRRENVVGQLPREWRGGVRCQDAEGRADRSWQLRFNFADVNPSGMLGGVGFEGTRPGTGDGSYGNTNSSSRGSANLVIRSPELSLPLEARLSLSGATDYQALPFTIDVSISESVVMSGVETTTWTIDNTPTEITCRYEFS